MSSKVKYNVGKLSVTQILCPSDAIRKLGDIPMKDRTKDALKQYVCLLYQPGTTLDNLTE